MKKFTPQQMVGGFNRKESGAIRGVYEKYFPAVLTMVEGITDCSPDSEDLTRNIFLRLLEHRGHFDTAQKIAAFLNNSAKNACQNYLEHQEVVKSNAGEIGRYYESINESSLEAAEIRAAQLSLVHDHAERLRPQCKQVFQLSLQGLGNREISRLLRISEKTVANQKTNAVKIIKGKVSKTGRRFWFLLYFLS